MAENVPFSEVLRLAAVAAAAVEEFGELGTLRYGVRLDPAPTRYARRMQAVNASWLQHYARLTALDGGVVEYNDRAWVYRQREAYRLNTMPQWRRALWASKQPVLGPTPHALVRQERWFATADDIAAGKDSIEAYRWVYRLRCAGVETLEEADYIRQLEIDIHAPRGLWAWPHAFKLVNEAVTLAQQDDMGWGSIPHSYLAWVLRQRKEMQAGRLSEGQKNTLLATTWWDGDLPYPIWFSWTYQGEDPLFERIIQEISALADAQPEAPPTDLLRPQKWYHFDTIRFRHDGVLYELDVDKWASNARRWYAMIVVGYQGEAMAVREVEPYKMVCRKIEGLRGWQW